MTKGKVRIDLLNWYGIIIATTTPKGVGITQGVMSRYTGRGIWLASLIASLAAALLMAVTLAALRRLGANLSRSLEQKGGPWAARPILVLEAVLHSLLYLGGAYTFVGHLQGFFLFETPLIVFLIAMALLALVAATYGFEVIARVAVIGAIGQAAITLLVVLGVVWDLNSLNLWPPAEMGWPRLFQASAVGLADMVMPLPLALSYFSAVEWNKGLVGRSSVVMLITGLTITLWALGEILVLGPAITGQHAVSCMALARAAAIGVFIHRYELIMVLVFLPAVLLMGALPLYATSGALARAVGLKERRPLLIPIAVALTVVCHWVLSDRLRSNMVFTYFWPYAMLGGVGCLLLVTLTTALLTKKQKPASAGHA